MEVMQNFAQNAWVVGGLFIAVGLVVLYFIRTPLKSLLSTVFGYRGTLDDYAFAIHKNRETIYDNELKRLTTGMNIKNGVMLSLAVLSTLINPILFAVVYGKYKISLLIEKSKKIKDFDIYEKSNDDDTFLKFFNTKSAKIDFVVDELMYSSYIFIAVGLYFGNTIMAGLGLSIIAIIQLVTFVCIYNGLMYKVNYKFVEYYRAMRLLDTSSLGGGKSLFWLGILSFASHFSPLAGFSIFIWALMATRFLLIVIIGGILKREDSVNRKHQEIENRDYTNLENIASYPNPISQSRGYQFSTTLQMKFFEIEKEATGKDLIHIDNYAFYPQAVNRTALRKNPLLLQTLAGSVKVSFEALDLTKQLLVLGGMGSGKTEAVNYMVEQIHASGFKKFKAIAFNDEAGDFVNRFYRANRDIITSLYDSRATVWCPFLEMKYNVEAGTAFLENLFNAIAGKEKDFFSGRAKQLTSQWLKESYFATASNIEAWEMFFAKIKEYEEELKAVEDKTKSSILQTIQIALEILSIMYFQIVVEKKKSFTFHEFVRTENIQLFFLNNSQFESKLAPYMTGLQAAYVIASSGKTQDEILDKKHLILNVFDEFLSMYERMDTATTKTLLTKIRKFLFCNILMAQYLPQDEKLIQNLDSSRYGLITFNINDDYTLEKVMKKLAKVEHLTANSSPQQPQSNSGSATTQAQNGEAFALGMGLDILNSAVGLGSAMSKDTLSYSLGETAVITEQQLQSMPKYHHLTFIPSEETKVLSGADAKRFFKLLAFGYDKLMANIAKKNDFLKKESGILYLGYTPQSTLTFNNDSFVKWDMREYYAFSQAKINEAKNGKIFQDEKEEFKHYMNIKFAQTPKNASKYIKANGLEKYDIKKMFENVEENEAKIAVLMEKYTEQERYELMEKFFEIDENDLEKRYDFVKEHDLIGCILGIFAFSEEFAKETLKSVDKGEL
jgi:hypothetical protein